jgi:hypothetical protein
LNPTAGPLRQPMPSTSSPHPPQSPQANYPDHEHSLLDDNSIQIDSPLNSPGQETPSSIPPIHNPQSYDYNYHSGYELEYESDGYEPGFRHLSHYNTPHHIDDIDDAVGIDPERHTTSEGSDCLDNGVRMIPITRVYHLMQIVSVSENRESLY